METGRDHELACTIEPGRHTDAISIAAVHVEVWRNAYAGILPDRALARLSLARLAAQYESAIRFGGAVLVARAHATGEVIGFTTFSTTQPDALAQGEIETLYVLDDWRERGVGRTLLADAARALAAHGCRSLFLWVLADNPSRWFYERLGGRPGMRATIRVGGETLAQIAMIWDRIDTLVAP